MINKLETEALISHKVDTVWNSAEVTAVPGSVDPCSATQTAVRHGRLV